MRIAMLLVGVLAAATCAPVHSASVRAGESCFRCGRAIAEPRLAGEIIEADGYIPKFRTVQCMARYLAGGPQEKAQAIFVTDYPTGRLVRAYTATFVRAEIDKTTGERDYLAFQFVNDAVAAGRRHAAPPVDWFAVMRTTRAALTE